MNATNKLESALLAEAWDWVLRLERSEEPSQDELNEWLRWYEADEAHKAAFDDMQGFWQQIDRVTDEPHPLPPALWLGDLALSKADAVRLLKPPREPWQSRLSRRFFLVWPQALAWGGAALLATVGVLVLRPVWAPLLPTVPVASVPAPAPSAVAQTTTLPDGSRVDLAPQSAVAVQYTERERLLRLQGGEGYFTVAHNRKRPFVVAVGSLRVRAVGTAFNVRSAGDRVVVTVAEGTVAVYPEAAQSNGGDATASPSGAIRVTGGSEVTWTPKGPVVAMVDPAHALAWRQGRLEYLNEPLASAVADLNRYSSHPILIRDAAVGRIVFSGTVLAAGTDAWVASLPSLFPVALEHGTDGSVILVSRPATVAPSGNPS